MMGFAASDLIVSIIGHIDSLACLGNLTQTCKTMKNIMLSSAASNAWLKAGETFCGSEHWPQIDTSLPRHNDARYVTMLRCFPYISNGTYCMTDISRSIWALGGRCNVVAVDRLHDFTALKLIVRGVAPNPIFQHVTQYVYVGIDPEKLTTIRHYSTVQTRCHDEFKTHNASDQEHQMMERLQREWHNFPLGNKNIKSIRMVHHGLMCVFCYTDAMPYDHVDIYFVATHSLNILFSMRQKTRVESVAQCFAFAPGEIWANFDDHRLVYFGPHKNWNAITRTLPIYQAMWAAFKGDTALAIQRLTRDGVDIPSLRVGGDIGLLHMAIESGHPDAVTYVLQRFPSCADDPNCLTLAIRKGNLDITRMLLDYGADPDESSLCFAVRTGATADMFHLLLEYKATACQSCLLKNVSASTPVCGVLDFILSKKPPCCKDLFSYWLQKGGDYSNHILAVVLLADNPPPVNTANDRGETPLMHAVATGVVANVQALLACGADPACRDAEGRTAADWCGGQQAETIRKMLARGF